MNDAPAEEVSRQHPVSEDMRMQHRVWRFERGGWYVLLVVIALALAGLFGSGPLSQAQQTSSDRHLRVDYERFSRTGSVAKVRITAQGQARSSLTVRLDGPIFLDANIETLQPQPRRSASQDQALLYQLSTDEGGMATLYLTLRTDSVGTLNGAVSLGPASAVRLATFIYP